MALSETTVGVLIGAGATVGGSLVTGLLAFLVDSRRRRWEDDRRWDDVRRRASVDFIAASRMAITRAARAANMRYALLVQRAQRPGVPDADLDQRIEELAATVQEDQENIDAWSGRLNDASAEIYLIATKPMRKAAEAHIKVMEELLDVVGREDVSTDDLLPQVDWGLDLLRGGEGGVPPSGHGRAEGGAAPLVAGWEEAVAGLTTCRCPC
jgi:hypothetical protein